MPDGHNVLPRALDALASEIEMKDGPCYSKFRGVQRKLEEAEHLIRIRRKVE